jgi:hypothetical protein
MTLPGAEHTTRNNAMYDAGLVVIVGSQFCVVYLRIYSAESEGLEGISNDGNQLR